MGTYIVVLDEFSFDDFLALEAGIGYSGRNKRSNWDWRRMFMLLSATMVGSDFVTCFL